MCWMGESNGTLCLVEVVDVLALVMCSCPSTLIFSNIAWRTKVASTDRQSNSFCMLALVGQSMISADFTRRTSIFKQTLDEPRTFLFFVFWQGERWWKKAVRRLEVWNIGIIESIDRWSSLFFAQLQLVDICFSSVRLDFPAKSPFE